MTMALFVEPLVSYLLPLVSSLVDISLPTKKPPLIPNPQSLPTMSEAFNKISQHLDDYQQQQANWKLQQFFVPFSRNFCDDTPVQVDLVPHIGHCIARMKKDVNKYWLPKCFNQNTPKYRQEVIAPIFERAALMHGFSIQIRQCIPLTQKAMKGIHKVQFICKRGRHHI